MRSTLARGSVALLVLALAGVVLFRRPAPAPPTHSPEPVLARTAAPPDRRLARLPSLLLPNGGELPPEVRYVLRDRNVSARFGDDRITWTAAGPRGRVELTRRFVDGSARPSTDGETGALVTRFAGGRAAWTSGLRAVRALVYPELWPGVNFRVEPCAAAVEYSFTVEPGRGLDRVRFAYEGLPAPTIDRDGALRVETPAGPLRESPPRAFQEIHGIRRELACAFEVRPDGSFGFIVPDRDPARALLVDPVLDYSTFLGWGNGGGSLQTSDEILDLKLDNAGNVVVAGRTSSDFPVTAGAYDRTLTGGDDYFVAKLNSTGTALLWATYLGGSVSAELEVRIAVDASNNVVVSGITNSDDFPTTPGAYRTTKAGFSSSFASKLSSDGATLLWSTFIGDGRPKGVALDPAGNVFIAGWTQSNTYPTTPGAVDVSYSGTRDAFVTCLASDGASLLWSTFLGDAGTEEAYCLAVGATGSVTVGGKTTSPAFPTTPGAFNTATVNPRGVDGFVTRIAAGGGSLVWSTYLRGSFDDSVQGLALDAASNVFLSVSAESNDFPTTPGTYKPTKTGALDELVLAKLTADGASLEWSTFVGPIGPSESSALIAVDASGNVYAAGYAQFNTFPTTPGAFDTTFSSDEAFALRMNAGGATLQWSTFIGGQLTDKEGVVALDGAGNLVVAASTGSYEIPTTPGAYDRTFNGMWDLVVLKLDAAGGLPVWSTFLGGGYNEDRGHALAVDGSGKVYVAGKTNSADFPVTPGAYDTTYNRPVDGLGSSGIDDAFIACFSADLSQLLWCTFLGGSGKDVVNAIALDSLGRVCVAGSTTSPNFPTTPGAFDTTVAFEEAFVARLSSDGQTLLMATLLGGANDDTGEGLVLGPADEFYLCGKAGLPASSDAYVACLSSNGSTILWYRTLASGQPDRALCLARGAGGEITVAGETEGTDFPTTPGAYDTSYNFNRDVFVARLSSDGSTVLWSTYLGSSTFDNLRGLVVDASGGVTVSGYVSNGGVWPTTPGAFSQTRGSAFISALSSDGSTLAWSTMLGDGTGGPHVIDAPGQAFVAGGLHSAFLTRVRLSGAQVPWGMGLAGGGLVDVRAMIRQPSGELILSGHTDRSNLPTTPGAYDTGFNGYFDVFVARLTPPTVTTIVNDGVGIDQNFHTSGTSLTANWSGFEPGASGYFLGLGVHRGTCDFVALTSMGAAISGTVTFPNVASGNRFHALVRADYPSGLSLLGTSNGVTLDHDGPQAPPAPTAAPALTQNAFTVSWAASTVDPGGAGFDFYEVFYSLNAGPLTLQSTGVTSTTLPVSGLPDGSYRWFVRGVDVLGNLGLFSAGSNIVVVDSTPPETTIVAGPQGAWGSTSAAFTFLASQAGCGFEVRLDGGVWELNGTTTTKAYGPLAPGPHTFEVRATDPAGNTDPTPALQIWTIGPPTVDGVAPVFNSFDSPLALSNWTIVATDLAAWAVDGSPASAPGGAAFSPPFSLNYNDGTDYATGAANSGSATSPSISLAGLTAPVLRFRCNYQTETPGVLKDVRSVRVSSDDFATNRIAEQLSTIPGAALLGACAASGTWHEHAAALNPAWGPVKIRFLFDTQDALSNAFAGWFIDDFGVTDALVSTMEQVDPLTTAVIPIGGASTGRNVEFRTRVAAGAVGTVRWEVEVQPVGTPFSGTPSGAVEGTAGSPLTLTLSMPGGTDFRWRARTVALTGGATSEWVAFGLNDDAEADVTAPPLPGGGGGGGGCGATPAELLLPLATLWLWNRRSRRLYPRNR